jgi:hypothetical protein
LSGSIAGGVGANSLTGGNVANTWSITSNNAGSVTGITGGFTGIQTLTGGSLNDTFVFADGISVSGTIDGGTSGINILDFGNYTTDLTITLTGSDVGGYNGTTSGTPNPLAGFTRIKQINAGTGENNLVTTDANTTITLTDDNSGTSFDQLHTLNFNNFATLTGGSGNNRLIGSNVTNTWNITATDAGNINEATQFTGFANLRGGSGNDTFLFDDGINVTGRLEGGTGTNTLNYTAYTSPITIDLNWLSNITNIIGSTNIGLNNNNTIQGVNQTATWTVTGNNSGTFSNGDFTITFTNFGNLLGGIVNDTFVFAAGSSLSGVINGGGGSVNTIDYSNYNAPVTVNLAQSTATGLTGLNSMVAITNFIANNAANNTFIADNTTNNWLLTNNNKGTINNSYSFDGFGNLVGGSLADVFTFLDSISVSGTINGAGGTNTLDYNNYTTPVNINLTNHTATGTNGYSNVDNFLGDTVTITP